MIVQNPLVPTPPAASGGSTSPVANAPAAPDNTRSETTQPVTPTDRGERASLSERGRTEEASEQSRSREGRPSDTAAPSSDSASARFATGEGRGQNVDIFA